MHAILCVLVELHSCQRAFQVAVRDNMLGDAISRGSEGAGG